MHTTHTPLSRGPRPRTTSRYVGRFAPSPTGPLHAGSLVAALASRLDAHAHDGRWLLRIEDLDRPREMAGATAAILDALERLGFAHDGAIVFQSRREAAYRRAFERLRAAGFVYPCGCTRREIADSLTRFDEPGGPSTALDGDSRTALEGGARPALVYPGTCRGGLPPGREARAWRLRVEADPVRWCDRIAGERSERLDETVGDFVVRRADGQWAYQLAVVVDDGAQGVTDVVRGADLRDSTARQVYLQRLLDLPAARYLHVPVVVDAHGEKLSKQTGAAPVDVRRPIETLNAALDFLGLGTVAAPNVRGWWPQAIERWAQRHPA